MFPLGVTFNKNAKGSMTMKICDLTYNEDFKSACDTYDLPVYVTHLRSGRIIFASKALADLVGYSQSELTSQTFLAKSLYLRAADRDDWEELVRRSKAPVLQTVELVRKPVVVGDKCTMQAAQKRLVVSDLAFAERDSEEDRVVLGMLTDVSNDFFDQEVLLGRLAAYREILDLPWVNIGIHEIDTDGVITWMNRKEMELLGYSDIPTGKHVVSLSGSKDESIGKQHRVTRKILGTCPLTLGEHRRFQKLTNHSKSYDDDETGTEPRKNQADDKDESTNEEAVTVHVNIHDFPIREPDPIFQQRWHQGLITVVRDEETHIASILEQFLPQNPLLSQLEISSFTKALRPHRDAFFDLLPHEIRNQLKKQNMQNGHERDLVFTFANDLFVKELSDSIARGGKKVSTVYDVLGRTEEDLFPDYAKNFSNADRDVMNLNAMDERIEKHPSPTGGTPIEVHVVKFPLYLPNDKERKKPVGVQGFYWPVETDIRAQLKKLYEYWDFIDSIPVRVYRKDPDGRFTFVNREYLNKVKKKDASLPLTLDDIIGKTDVDIFGDAVGANYESDDEIVRGSQDAPPFDQLEPHGDGIVRVIKTPITSDHGVGVQGIFWEPSEQELARLVWIDWLKNQIHVIGKEPIQIDDPETVPWRIFRLLADGLNKTVPYDTIGAKVFQDPRIWVDKKKLNKLASQITSLRKNLEELRLDDCLEVIPESKTGYRLKFEFDPWSKYK